MRSAPWLLLALLVLPLASAKTVTFYFEALDDGFHVPGYDEANPLLAIDAGSTVTILVRNNGSAAHNLIVGAPVSKAMPCCLRPGESATLTFDLPADASGDVSYRSEGAPDARGLFRVGPPLPRVRFLEPEEGATVGREFTARVRVDAFVLEPYPTNQPPLAGHGHVRFLVDGANATPFNDRPERVFENLPVGHHFLRVELAGRDGAPLDPPAFDEVLVYRAADAPLTPSPDGDMTPTSPDRTPLAPVLALAAIAIASLSRRRR